MPQQVHLSMGSCRKWHRPLTTVHLNPGKRNIGICNKVSGSLEHIDDGRATAWVSISGAATSLVGDGASLLVEGGGVVDGSDTPFPIDSKCEAAGGTTSLARRRHVGIPPQQLRDMARQQRCDRSHQGLWFNSLYYCLNLFLILYFHFCDVDGYFIL